MYGCFVEKCVRVCLTIVEGSSTCGCVRVCACELPAVAGEKCGKNSFDGLRCIHMDTCNKLPMSE